MQMTRAQYDQALDFATQPLEDQVARLTEHLRRRDAEIERLRARLKLWDPGEAEVGSGSVTYRSHPAYNTAE